MLEDISNIEKYNENKKIKKQICQCLNYLNLSLFPPRAYDFEHFLLLLNTVEKKLLEGVMKEPQPKYIKAIFSKSFKEKLKEKSLLDFDKIIKLLGDYSGSFVINGFQNNKDLLRIFSPQYSARKHELYYNCFIVSSFAFIHRMDILDALKKLASLCQIDFKCFDFSNNETALIKKSKWFWGEEKKYLFINHDYNNEDFFYIFHCLQYGQFVFLPGLVDVSYFFKQKSELELYNSKLIKKNTKSPVVIIHNDIPVTSYLQEIYYRYTYRNTLGEMIDKIDNIIDKYKTIALNIDDELLRKTYDSSILQEDRIITYRESQYNKNKFDEVKSQQGHPVINSLSFMHNAFSLEPLPNKTIGDNLYHIHDLESDIVFASYYSDSILSYDLSPLQNRKVIYMSKIQAKDKKNFYIDCLKFINRIRDWENIHAKKLEIDLFFIGWPTKENDEKLFSLNQLILDAYYAEVEIPDSLQFELNEILIRSNNNLKLRFLIDPVIGEKSYNLLTAERGSGKTWLALGMAYSYATGKNIHKEWKIKEPGKVLFVNGEVSHELIVDRSLVFRKMHKNSPDLKNVILYTPEDDIDLLTEQGQKVIEKEIGRSLNEGGNIPVSLLVLDSLLFLAPNGTTSNGWPILQSWIKNLKQKGISVLLLHHMNKKDSSYGTIKIENYADSIIYLQKKEIRKTSLKINVLEEKNKRAPDGNEFLLSLFFNRKHPTWKYSKSKVSQYTWRSIEEFEKTNIIIEMLKTNNVQCIAEEFGVSKSTIEKFKQNYGIYIRKNSINS